MSQMEKFKPLRESVKPMIALSIESRLAELEKRIPFRKDNIAAISSYFVSVLRIFEKLGYKKVGKIYIDGTKIKANASKKRTKTVKVFEKWLSLLEEEIANILKEAAVTVDGVITAGEAVEECNDRHQLEPMIEKSESNTGKTVDEVAADGGYASYDNYEYLDKRKINGYVPDRYLVI